MSKFVFGINLSLLLSACGLNASLRTQSTSQNQATQLESTPDVRAGDIVLVPLNCYVCNAIEAETGAPYSHSVVVANSTQNPNERFVYEAWGISKKTPYSEIVARKQKNQALALLRPREFQNGKVPSEEQLQSIFESRFRELPFDDEYLWDNFDDQGKEKMYCSEFVVKFMNSFLTQKILPKPMTFAKNFEFWTKYYLQFQITPPTGKLGASPATLLQSQNLLQLGKLN